MKIALLQLNSGADIQENVIRVGGMVRNAAAAGASFIALPENCFQMQEPGREPERHSQDSHPGVLAARGWAVKYGVGVLVGSVAVYEPASGKYYNRSLLITRQGDIVASYDKIHLFDVDVPGDRSYRESDKMLAGDKLVVAPPVLDGAVLGLTICYDVRFPHLYRALAKKGANILCVPAAFTQITGEAHWHVLLRARAIENGCFVIAPAQTGTHPGNRKTYGHSLVVDPWGDILADGGAELGIVYASIDLGEVAKVRTRLPSLEHDRDFD